MHHCPCITEPTLLSPRPVEPSRDDQDKKANDLSGHCPERDGIDQEKQIVGHGYSLREGCGTTLEGN
jgi:hypothetical protein